MTRANIVKKYERKYTFQIIVVDNTKTINDANFESTIRKILKIQSISEEF